MKDVYTRVVPYFDNEILPKLKKGENVLIAAHGNSLRALTKHLCNLSEDEVCNLEIGMGEAHIYEIDANGKVVSSEIKGFNENRGKI